MTKTVAKTMAEGRRKMLSTLFLALGGVAAVLLAVLLWTGVHAAGNGGIVARAVFAGIPLVVALIFLLAVGLYVRVGGERPPQ